MRIGFDFDGVIVEPIHFDGDIPKYNSAILKAKLQINPMKFKNNSDDKIFIITGRCFDNYLATKNWLHFYLPKFKLNNLFFINPYLSTQISNIFDNYEDYIEQIAFLKYKKIAELNIDIYFEDNEIIAKYLKNNIGKECKIILVKNDISVQDLIKEVTQNEND